MFLIFSFGIGLVLSFPFYMFLEFKFVRDTVFFILAYFLGFLASTFIVLVVEKNRLKASPVYFALGLFILINGVTLFRELGTTTIGLRNLIRMYSPLLIGRFLGAVVGGLAASSFKKEIKLSLIST